VSALDDPGDVSVATGECFPDYEPASAMFVAQALRAEAGRLGRASYYPCASCRAATWVGQLGSHIERDRDKTERTQDWVECRELQEWIPDAHLVCRPCHEILHDHSLADQELFARPACPKCGGREPRRILYGMPAFGEYDEDDFVLGGCL